MVVELLLQYKANPDMGDNAGVTPLWAAAESGRPGIAAKLVKARAMKSLDSTLCSNYAETCSSSAQEQRRACSLLLCCIASTILSRSLFTSSLDI